MGIVQLVAHEVGESILSMRVGSTVLDDFGEDLLFIGFWALCCKTACEEWNHIVYFVMMNTMTTTGVSQPVYKSTSAHLPPVQK